MVCSLQILKNGRNEMLLNQPKGGWGQITCPECCLDSGLCRVPGLYSVSMSSILEYIFTNMAKYVFITVLNFFTVLLQKFSEVCQE